MAKLEGLKVGISAKKSFGYALELLKHGKKVIRKGWNGKGMYVQKVENMDFESLGLLPFLVIKNTKGTFNTWVPSISDLFSEDWEEVEL